MFVCSTSLRLLHSLRSLAPFTGSLTLLTVKFINMCSIKFINIHKYVFINMCSRCKRFQRELSRFSSSLKTRPMTIPDGCAASFRLDGELRHFGTTIRIEVVLSFSFELFPDETNVTLHKMRHGFQPRCLPFF